MGSALLEVLGLPEVAGNSDDVYSAEAKEFRQKFLDSIKQVNASLQMTTVHGPPVEHTQVESQREKLYTAYQKVATQLDSGKAEVAERDAGRVLAAADALGSRASSLARDSTASHQRWAEQEGTFDDADAKVVELEDANHPKASVMRTLIDVVRERVLARSYGEALNALEQVVPKITANYEAFAADQGVGATAIPQAATDNVRTVPGGGGYVYEQHADGSIFIVQSPIKGDARTRVKEGTKGYKAIADEIGAFPGTAPPTASPAGTQGPAEPSRHPDQPATSSGPSTGGGAATRTVPSDDSGLKEYVAGFENPTVSAIASDLADLQERFRAVGREVTEEKGAERDRLVEGIGELRTKIASLEGSGIDPSTLSELQARLHRALNDITPYYSQGRNIDLLEGKAQAKELGTKTSVNTRTCNITSLGMALESLGKSAANYDRNKRADVLAAAKVFSSEVRSAKLTVDGGEGWDALKGLRFTDFLQLAAIAEKMAPGTTSKRQIESAARSAWKAILGIGFLKALAGRFGVAGVDKWFSLDASDTSESGVAWQLRKIAGSTGRRREVTMLSEIRNELEAAESDSQRKKLQQRYDRQLAKLGGSISSSKDEKQVPLESYRKQLIQQVGGELDRGCAVVVLIRGHYVRLQAIHDDHVIVDDPGRQSRANLKVTYEEAREMGYFFRRLVLGP